MLKNPVQTLKDLVRISQRLDSLREIDAKLVGAEEMLRTRLAKVEETLARLEQTRISDFSKTTRMILHERRIAFENLAVEKGERRPGVVAQPRSMEADLKSLEVRFPKAFPIWRKLFNAGAEEYEAHPEGNLSLPGHAVAEMFRDFLTPYASGHVLDIGCGPQAWPAYFSDLKIDRLAGLDPLSGSSERAFEVAQGLAEYLPWQDAEFDCVVMATSLDHVLSIDMTFAEINRVLRPNGRLVLWVGFIPGSQPYSPDDPNVGAVDEYHMFHFDQGWFEELMSKNFQSVDEMMIDGVSFFSAFRKKTHS